MGKITYYRAMIALPVPAAGLAWMATGAAALPIMAGALPYALTAITLLIASARLSERRFFTWCHVAPFVAALWFIVTMCAFFAYHAATGSGDAGRVDLEQLAGISLVGSVYCLGVGYAFVALAKILEYVLEALRVIRVAPSAGPFSRP